MTFVTADSAMRYCDTHKNCNGVAQENGLFFAVEKVSKEKRKLNENLSFELKVFYQFIFAKVKNVEKLLKN